MSHFIQKLKDHFSFRRGERVGLSLMIILIVIILAIPYVYKFFKKEGRTDFTLFDIQVREFQNRQSTISSQQSAKISRKYQVVSRKTIKGLSANIYQQSVQNYQRKQENFVVEINGADSLELMRMNGIGPAFARRIIRYRQLLGGYFNREQLLEVWGMDSSRYSLIKTHVIVNRDSIHKININSITFKKLMKHPYIGYNVARGVMDYRMKHGEFNSIKELRKVKNINDSIYNRIEPYVKVR